MKALPTLFLLVLAAPAAAQEMGDTHFGADQQFSYPLSPEKELQFRVAPDSGTTWSVEVLDPQLRPLGTAQVSSARLLFFNEPASAGRFFVKVVRTSGTAGFTFRAAVTTTRKRDDLWTCGQARTHLIRDGQWLGFSSRSDAPANWDITMRAADGTVLARSSGGTGAADSASATVASAAPVGVTAYQNFFDSAADFSGWTSTSSVQTDSFYTYYYSGGTYTSRSLMTDPLGSVYPTVYNPPATYPTTVAWNVDGTPASLASGGTSLNFNDGVDCIDDAKRPYTAKVVGTTRSPWIDLSQLRNPVLRFSCKVQIESISEATRTMTVTGEGNATRLYSVLSYRTTCQAGVSTTPTEMRYHWHLHEYNLDPTWGKVRIEFGFSGLDILSPAGWFIDDLSVSGTRLEERCESVTTVFSRTSGSGAYRITQESVPSEGTATGSGRVDFSVPRAPGQRFTARLSTYDSQSIYLHDPQGTMVAYVYSSGNWSTTRIDYDIPLTAPGGTYTLRIYDQYSRGWQYVPMHSTEPGAAIFAPTPYPYAATTGPFEFTMGPGQSLICSVSPEVGSSYDVELWDPANSGAPLVPTHRWSLGPTKGVTHVVPSGATPRTYRAFVCWRGGTGGFSFEGSLVGTSSGSNAGPSVVGSFIGSRSFPFVLQPGDSLTAKLQPREGTDYDLLVLDPVGNIVSTGRNLNHVVPSTAPGGAYSVHVAQRSKANGYYTLEIRTLVASGAASAVSGREAVTQTYSLSPGDALRIELTMTRSADYDTEIKDPKGAVVATTVFGAGRPETLTYRVPADGPSGTYRATISKFGGLEGIYAAWGITTQSVSTVSTVSTTSPTSPTSPTATPSVLQPDGIVLTQANTIYRWDPSWAARTEQWNLYEWVSLSLTAGRAYVVEVSDINTSNLYAGHTASTTPYFYIRPYFGTNAFQAEQVFLKADSRMVFVPSATGTHYLVLRAADKGTMGRCTLKVSYYLSETPPFELYQQPFYWSAYDYYRWYVGTWVGEFGYVIDYQHGLRLRAGKKYVIHTANAVPLASKGSGDPYLYLLDSSGIIVAEDNDGGGSLQSRIEFTCPTDGLYWVRLRANQKDTYGRCTLSFGAPN